MKKTHKQEMFFAAPDGESESGTPAAVPAPPLAERCRPDSLDEIFGQDELLGLGQPLRKAIESDRVPSMILWGPPGSGKTTLARLLAKLTKAHFLQLSATDSGIKDLRKIVDRAKATLQSRSQKTILFIDEIHRWNKSQQDALLPHVESGLIQLIGATTENPSFEVNAALLSRVTVYTLALLDDGDLMKILKRAVSILVWEGEPVSVDDEALQAIVQVSHGDARTALTALEQAVSFYRGDDGTVVLTQESIAKALQDKRILYDKSGEEHFNCISALHKSMRGSDPQGTLYWLARMIEGGEDPLYIVRRIVRFAAEDVGLADPNALLIANAARDSYHFLGSPEGELAIAQAAVYMATAPKSNALYKAFGEALASVKERGYLPVPMHIRNAPTKLMDSLGYGKGYRYAHDFDHAYAAQSYLPDELHGKTFYQPTDRGFENKIAERMKFWKELSQKQNPK